MKLRSWALTIFLAAGLVAPVAGPAQVACAAGGNHAALVVDTGADVYEMCVAFDEAWVSGIKLIKLAAQQHDLDYALGYGGRGVCRLANVPDEEPSQECLKDHEEFWGYWRGDGSGGWMWSGVGPASTQVRNGDVEGWSYGVGRDESSHAPPGAGDEGARFRFKSICAGAESTPKDDDDDGEPRDKPSEREDKNDVTIPLPGDNEGKPKPKDKETPGAAPSAPPEPDERLIDSAPDLSELEITPSPSPTSEKLPASATSARSQDDDDRGAQPPIAGVLALIVTMAMAGVAVYLIRRRTPEPED